MVYTLVFEFIPQPFSTLVPNVETAEVVVFLPEATDWREFVEGVETCERRGILRVLHRNASEFTLGPPQGDLRLRLIWNSTGGLRGTRDQVSELTRRARPPIAMIGSTTSILTVALARQLKEETRAGDASSSIPLLLIPWATTVMVEKDDPTEGPVALLDIYPGRSFRFCPNNRREADFLVDCVVETTSLKTLPRRAYLVVDRKDPYSTDMADAFRHSIARAAPEVEIIEEPKAVSGQSSPETPSPSEHALAAEIWTELAKSTTTEPTWVILPLQAEPCRRMLAALSIHARKIDHPKKSLFVLCGDGIGIEELSDYATKPEFPIWCVSSGVAPNRAAVSTAPAKVPAEIITSLIIALENCRKSRLSTESLRQSFISMDLVDSDPRAFGRAIAFVASGERKGGG